MAAEDGTTKTPSLFLRRDVGIADGDPNKTTATTTIAVVVAIVGAVVVVGEGEYVGTMSSPSAMLLTHDQWTLGSR